MRKFNVTVEGKMYEVEVEEVAVGSIPASVVSPVASPVPQAIVKTAPVADATTGEKLLAPMPGSILELKFKNGDTVKKGEVVILLEAMKMENDIVANCDGVITYIVSKGVNVNSSDVIAVFN